MALDLHVMPLERFLTGDFESPAEKAAREQGVPYERVGRPKPSLPVETARGFVATLRGAVARFGGVAVEWDETDRSPALSVTWSFEALHLLRAFAAHLDHPGGAAFDPTDRPQEHPSVRKVYAGAFTHYIHLLDHADHEGFYLPGDFARPLWIDFYGDAKPFSAGSSVRLLAELESLSRSIESNPSVRADVRHAWTFFAGIARESVVRRQPLIFEG